MVFSLDSARGCDFVASSSTDLLPTNRYYRCVRRHHDVAAAVGDGAVVVACFDPPFLVAERGAAGSAA